ncbi:MAG TPA: branched-chain amino acid ABC transporter permease [Firmicutes bacterium]|jgi:branched-chain amino acid transport system permease protein|nr:branched-chain amino acid ABC transporter permease [Bacillota bacterium]HAW69617.1 branched-chain amino acid ABC transporter permease [Bacillota bacterium]HAZ20974.1 branched-chain amino acid ABC transporter permease [Bacillota bacterium]HBE06685.1 branched-chain amino acid ABC transporter permease [Bacillota bacterium]HBG43635.1 branched-chain amino acid ABC transporter permease [Bacillota bacterium]
MIIQLIISGLAIGSVYSLVALAHSLIWSGVRAVNFAQGEVFMAAAFVALTALSGAGRLPALPFGAAVLVGVVAASLIGLVIYNVAIRTTSKKGFLYALGACIGFSTLLQSSAILIWGSTGEQFPAQISMVPLRVGSIFIAPQDLFIMGISLTAMIILYFFLSKTRLGTAMRAAAQNREVAGLMGISHRLTDSLTFMVASCLAGLAGILLAPKFFVTPQMGSMISSKGFTAAVLGGFGSIPGAVLGGLLLGVLENISAGLISSSYKDAISFLIMVLIIMFKPEGLLGVKGGRKA